jgi:PTS system fructose-specific IIA component/PTS system nitrogen regulatory IIA component
MQIQFSKVISEKNVFTQIEGTDRDDVLRRMVKRLADAGEILLKDVKPILSGLLAREELGTTGIGKGIAIPHLTYEGVDRLLIAVGQSDDGLEFSAVDGGPVVVIFLILAPKRLRDEYLAALRWVSNIARDDYNNKLLNGSRTAGAFTQLFKDIEDSQ